MKLLETTKFSKLRNKLREATEKRALKSAILQVSRDPNAGKKLKGEFRDLRSFQYTVKGQSRRLIYKTEKHAIILFSFGPREGIYK